MEIDLLKRFRQLPEQTFEFGMRRSLRMASGRATSLPNSAQRSS